MMHKKYLFIPFFILFNCFFTTQSNQLQIDSIIQDFLTDNFESENGNCFSEKEIALFFIEFLKKKSAFPVSLSYQLIDDMNLIKNQIGGTKNIFTLFSTLAPTKTVAGKTATGVTLLNPIHDIPTLCERQNIIKTFKRHNKDEMKEIMDHLFKMEAHEQFLLKLAAEKNLVTQTEEKLLFSRFPVFQNQINNNRILYNIMTIIPLFLQAAIIPVALYSLCLYLAHLLIKTTDKKVGTIIQKLIERDGKTKAEIVENYLQLIKSMSKEELQEKLRSMTSYVVQTKGSLNDFDLFGVFGGMPIIEQEKILKKVKHTFQEDIDFVTSNYNAIIERTNGKAKNAMATILGIPSLLLSGQYIKQLQIIFSKTREFREYLIHAAQYLFHFDEITSIIEKIPELQNSSLAKQFIKIQDNIEAKRLRSLLRSHAFKDEKNWYDIGTVFVTFQEFIKQKDCITEAALAIGELDMYLAIAQFMNYCEGTNEKSLFCFVEYYQNEQTPIIEAKKFWNPFILSHKTIDSIVPNSILLGKNEKQNSIITGPNTCGKTTIMFGLLLNAILGQTFGIAAAEEFLFTPFQEFHLTASVTTNSAVGDSKFKAEVREAIKILSALKNAETGNYFVLTIQDEIFTGTNPQDGKEAAYQFLEKIGQFKNSITIIATHYHPLTSLNNLYELYKINASITNENIVEKPFTIEKGISDLNIARIILKEAGF